MTVKPISRAPFKAAVKAAIAKAKAAVADAAKKGEVSVVFVQDVAPYSANDITADALKSMNGKK
jgi:hypothetical protein